MSSPIEPGMLDLDGGEDLIESVNFSIFHNFFFQYIPLDLINYTMTRFEKDWIGNWEEVVWDVDGNWSGLEVKYFRTWKKKCEVRRIGGWKFGN